MEDWKSGRAREELAGAAAATNKFELDRGGVRYVNVLMLHLAFSRN